MQFWGKVNIQFLSAVKFQLMSSDLDFSEKQKINQVHKRALRALFGGYESTFEYLLTKNNEIAIHRKKLAEIYDRDI